MNARLLGIALLAAAPLACVDFADAEGDWCQLNRQHCFPPEALGPETVEIQGTLRVGSVVRATEGLWATGGTSYSYTWLSCDASNLDACVTIGNGPELQLPPEAEDSATNPVRLRVAVQAWNLYGNAITFSAPRLVGPSVSLLDVWGFEEGAIPVPELYSLSEGSVFLTSTAHSGRFGLQVTSSSANPSRLVRALPVFPGVAFVFRVAMYIPARPQQPTALMTMTHTDGKRTVLAYDPGADRLGLYLQEATATIAVSTAAPPIGRWFFVDLSLTSNGSESTGLWAVDGALEPNLVSLSAGSVSSVELGVSRSDSPFTVLYDDAAQSFGLQDFPIGPGRVLPRVAARLNTANLQQGWYSVHDLAGERDVVLASGAHQAITDWPLADSALRDANPDTTLLPIELVAPTTTLAPRSVRLTYATHTYDGATTPSAAFSVRAGTGSEQFNYDSTGFLPRYAHRTYTRLPGSVLPWSADAYSQLTVFWGSTDAATVGQPMLDGLLIQGEFPMAPPAR